MKILAIETSCDDTCVAVLSAPGGPASGGEGNFKVLSNIIASQTEVHKKYGGVFPAMAKREHQKNLPAILEKVLKNTKDIDLIAITNGPGLEPCLWVGVNFAKELSLKLNIPLVPINHIEGHILVNLLNNKIEFPALALVVSGGHTQLILVKKIGSYKILGETRDDAAGECFDKCAKILGLGYPGGPIISKLADIRCPSVDGHRMSIQLPRPMMHTKDYDFSFSGLKTAVLYTDRKVKNKTKEYKYAMAGEIQQAIIDVLLKKTIKAAKDYKVKTIILGGGVSANQELRNQFSQIPGIRVVFPTAQLSTDNAVMIAITAYFHQKGAMSDLAKLRVEANLRISK